MPRRSAGRTRRWRRRGWGRDRKKKLRRDWESVKVSVLREAVLASSSSTPTSARCSCPPATRSSSNTENDDYWGDGGDGSGRNMLGQLLMEVRRRLRDE